MENLKKSTKIFIAFGVMLSVMFIYLSVPYLYRLIPSPNDIWLARYIRVLKSFVWDVIIACVCFTIVKKGLKRNIGITKKNFFLCAIIYGYIMIIYCVINFINSFPFSLQGKEVDYGKALGLIPVYLISCIGIGIGEEAVWRVLAVNIFCWAFGDDKKNAFISITISSILFGLAHLNNLITPPRLYNDTISQVFYATMMGFFFSVIYFKSKNILPCIIYHALFDFAYYGSLGFYPPNLINQVISTDCTFIEGLLNALSNLPLLIFAILLYFGIFKALNDLIKRKK